MVSAGGMGSDAGSDICKYEGLVEGSISKACKSNYKLGGQIGEYFRDKRLELELEGNSEEVDPIGGK